MIGRIDEVVFDCADPARLAQFWAGVLGGELVERDPSWCYLDPPGWTRLAFQRVPEPERSKNRLHLDVQVDDLAVAVAAAETLGARRVGEVERDSVGWFQVLLDPEDNEWCLVHNEVRVPPSSAR